MKIGTSITLTCQYHMTMGSGGCPLAFTKRCTVLLPAAVQLLMGISYRDNASCGDSGDRDLNNM